MKSLLIFFLSIISFAGNSQSINVTAYKQHWYGGASYNSGSTYSITIVGDSSELSGYTFLSAELDDYPFFITETSIKHRSPVSITFCFEIFHDHREIIYEKNTEIEIQKESISNTLTFIHNKIIRQISIDTITELFPIHYP